MLIESIKNLFSKPAIVKYPSEPSPPPLGYRGLIIYRKELCIFCTRCEMVCPPGAIRFTRKEDGTKEFEGEYVNGKLESVLSHFDEHGNISSGYF